MTKTVVGSFDTFEHAHGVVTALGQMGVPQGDLNVVANDAAGRLVAGRGAGPSAGRGAVAGGVVGGTAGLIAGLAGLAVPGIGPLVAAGPIAATLTGAGIGAVAGGLIGGLRAVGVSDADAEYYAEAVRRGGALVIVKADDARATAVADVMRRHGVIDIESRVAAWRASGWSGFDESAHPYSHEQIEREQVAYRTGGGMPQAVDRGHVDDLRTGASAGSGVPGSGTTTGSGTLGGGSLGAGRSSEHPNLGPAPDKPGVDTRSHEHGRRAGMSAGHDEGAPGSAGDAARRAGDAIERSIPGDADGDGR